MSSDVLIDKENLYTHMITYSYNWILLNHYKEGTSYICGGWIWRYHSKWIKPKTGDQVLHNLTQTVYISHICRFRECCVVCFIFYTEAFSFDAMPSMNGGCQSVGAWEDEKWGDVGSKQHVRRLQLEVWDN